MTTLIKNNINNNTTRFNSNSNNNNMSVPANTKKPFAVSDASTDIPIFLRKTYHMVDTCDPTVCSWSEDGETFVVKHPKKFEQEIIPQFFKHSKFSSFVRQLNFYAFRKIKTNDSIRIDAALEAATANYWRFYHPKFQRGKPEWLQDIKRSSSTPRGSGAKKTGTGAKATPVNVKSSGAALGKENSELKSEVTSLKERIEAMNKNIDMLTTMVQNVSMAQKAQTEAEGNTSLVNKNNKRTKTQISTPACVPDDVSSSIAVPDAAPSMPLPVPLSNSIGSNVKREDTDVFLRETSHTSELSDQGFVDTLFTAFKAEDQENEDVMGDVIDLASGPDMDADSMKLDDSPWLKSSPMENSVEGTKERPSAELMNRLSDALSLLPREIQELIVDRLIQAITSPKKIQENLQISQALKDVAASATSSSLPTSVPLSPRRTSASCDDSAMMTDDEHSTAAASVVPSSTPATPADKPAPNPSLPLAAATLAALLSQYGKEPQCAAAVVAATNVLIPVTV